MSTLQQLPSIDYSSRDYSAIMSDFLDLIPFYAPELWTDLNNTDLGITALQLFAYMGDILHFYVDRRANNLYLSTTSDRESAANLLKLIDYEMLGASPSSTDLTFTLGAPLAGTLTITAGLEIQTSGADGIIFETNEDLDIAPGSLTGTVTATQGQTVSEDLGLSDGTAYQEFKMISYPIIQGSVSVFVKEGAVEEEWEESDDLVDAGPLDKKYWLQRDSEGKISIAFGDNGHGKIPALNAEIRAEGRVGGGSSGNVGRDTITQINDPITYLGSPVTASVNNPNPASGGLNEESIESARLNGPRSLRALYRAVTLEDYETLSLRVGGVAKSLAKSRDFRTVDVYIAPEGGGQPSQALKDSVKDYLDERRIVTILTEVSGSVYVPVWIAGTVYVYDNYTQADVQAEVEAALTAFLAFDSQAFGQDLHLSDIYAVIENTLGVDYVDLTRVSRIPVPAYDPWVGDASVTVTFSSSTLQEAWTLSFFSPTQFNLVGTVSGSVGPGTIDVPLVAGGITTLVQSGVTPPNIGDTAIFKTSTLLGNIAVENEEIVIESITNLTFSGGA